jgi:hypothetical protein
MRSCCSVLFCSVLFSTPNIIRVIKLRMTKARHVAHMAAGGGNRSAYRVLVRRPEGKYWENPSVD